MPVALNSRLPNEITRPAGSGSETPMEHGLDVPAIPRDQTGKREKMSRSNPLPGAPTIGVPTRGSGSQLVNAVCFLVPDVDARGNTVTHGFILVPAAGPYVQQRGCARALYYVAPDVLVVGGYKQGERGRETPKSLLGVESAWDECSVVPERPFGRKKPESLLPHG